MRTSGGSVSKGMRLVLMYAGFVGVAYGIYGVVIARMFNEVSAGVIARAVVTVICGIAVFVFGYKYTP